MPSISKQTKPSISRGRVVNAEGCDAARRMLAEYVNAPVDDLVMVEVRPHPAPTEPSICNGAVYFLSQGSRLFATEPCIFRGRVVNAEGCDAARRMLAEYVNAPVDDLVMVEVRESLSNL